MRRTSKRCTRPTSTTPARVPDNWRAYFDALQHVPATDGIDGPRRAARAGRRILRRSAPRPTPSATRASSDDLADRPQAGPRPVADRRLPLRSARAGPTSIRSSAPSARRFPSSSRRSTTSPRPTWTSVFSATNTYFTTAEHMTLREIVQALRETYCGTIGAEYMHITEPAEKRWWQQQLEAIRSQAELHRRAEEAHPRPPDRGRRPRALPAHQVRRPEALLARRRRELHRLDGRAHAARRRQGRAGDRHRHGAPRPPERAGQHAGQDAEGPVRRVRPHRARRTCRRATSSTTRASRATSPRPAARCT